MHVSGIIAQLKKVQKIRKYLYDADTFVVILARTWNLLRAVFVIPFAFSVHDDVSGVLVLHPLIFSFDS